MSLKLVNEPITDPVTLEEAKQHLNVTFDDYDELIAGYIKSAQMGIVYNTGHALSPATWDLAYDAFPTGNDPEGYVEIPIGPLISVESINYVDPDTESEVVLGTSEYEVDNISRLGGVMPIATGWPVVMETINAVRIRFVAGYPDAGSPQTSTVPASLKHAVLLLVRDMYDYRSPTVLGGLYTARREVVRYLTDPFQQYWI